MNYTNSLVLVLFFFALVVDFLTSVLVAVLAIGVSSKAALLHE
jgi:hypothetical protein